MPSKEATCTAATVYSHLSKNQLVPSLSLKGSLSSQSRETNDSLPAAFKIPDWFLLYPHQLLSTSRRGRPATVFLQLSKYVTGSFSILLSFSPLSREGGQQQSSYSFQNTGLVPSLSLPASLSSQGRETSNSLPPAFKIPFWFLLYPYQLLSTSREGKPLPLKREIPSPFHRLVPETKYNDFKIN
jgi:hypothetical protein